LSATTTDSSEALGPGNMVGKYRISARLGEGAMGVVYSAVHERLGRPVAIKVLRRELSDNTELSSRFQMEAELVTRIGHPNIVAVYDFGRLADGCLYYVMEMIAGDSLRARLKRGTLSDQEIVEVFGPLLSAVRAAHEIGVVHRDLKPDNVMLVAGSSGTAASVKLLDFGIAKIRDEQPGVVKLHAALDTKDGLATAAGAIMGTPAYMAPEQIKNSSGVDKRADIYAIGIMLYEALAGQRPFSGGSSAELLGAHLYQEATPPSETAKQKGIPERKVPWRKVDPVVLRAIAKAPAERYQDCSSLQQDLEAAWGQSFSSVRGASLSGTVPLASLTANPALPLAASASSSARRTGVLAAGVAVAVLLAGGSAYFLRGTGTPQVPTAAKQSGRAQELLAKATAGSPAERRMLMEAIDSVGARAHLPLLAQGLSDDDPGVSRAALQAVLRLGQPGDTLLAEPLQGLAGQQVGAMAVDLAAARMRIGEPDAQGVLMAMLQSPIPTPEARLRAALAVAEAGKLPRAPLRQALEAALRSGTVLKALRRDALVKLVVLQDPEALNQLQAAAQSGAAGGEQQTEALLVLALAHQKNAAENLRMAAELASGSDLIELAVVLAQVRDKRAVGLLLPLLKDVQPKVRLRALGALCQLASAGLFPAYEKTLAPLLSDADPQVALTAAVALLGIGQPVPALTQTAAP
jgi:serine/threonine protein kinase